MSPPEHQSFKLWWQYRKSPFIAKQSQQKEVNINLIIQWKRKIKYREYKHIEQQKLQDNKKQEQREENKHRQGTSTKREKRHPKNDRKQGTYSNKNNQYEIRTPQVIIS